MEIKVYSRNGDPYSEMLKSILKYHNVVYENIEVSRDKGALQTMIDLSGQEQTPVLVVDGKVYVGFDRELIKNVLGFSEHEGK